MKLQGKNNLEFDLQKVESASYLMEVENAFLSTQELQKRIKEDLKKKICQSILESDIIHFEVNEDSKGRKILRGKLYVGQILKEGKII